MSDVKQNTFSIVIPTIGRKLLDDTIQSVLEQTHLPDEIIIFDNSGTQTVRSQSKWHSHPLISWHESKEKKDIISSWNTAVSYSHSDYIYILGDDDLLLPDFVSFAQAKIAQGYDMIYVPPQILSPDGKCSGMDPANYIKGEISFSQIARHFSKGVNYPIYLSTQIFSKKVFKKIEGFKPIIVNALAMDHLFHLELARSSTRLYFSCNALWKYRANVSDWSGKINDVKTILKVSKQFKNYFDIVNQILSREGLNLQDSFFRKYLIDMISLTFPPTFAPLKLAASLLICFFPYRSWRKNILLIRSWFYLFRHHLLNHIKKNTKTNIQ